MITSTSSPMMSNDNCITAPSRKISLKADLLRRMSKINNGNMTGKPKMAISAAFCCAFAAIALIRVKTKLMLLPPNNTINKNLPACVTGLLKKR